MKIETIIKRVQIMGYKSDPDDYDFVLSGEIEADMVLFQNLKGDGFYKAFDEIFDLLRLEYGINHIYATLTKRHTKLGLRVLGKRYKVKLIRQVENAGRKMYLVCVTKP